jgi:ActR/RegA family two-component response regulator
VSLVPETIALDELVAESLRLNQGYADRFHVRLQLEGDLPKVTVRADRKRLMQVMTNLLSNAAKFSPPRGSVDVAASVRDGKVRVAVGDRGPGIPEKFRSRIFGRFAQADSADSHIKGGAGLGLAICKRLVELMQGHIGFEDRPGGGTAFFFELPVMDASEAAAADAVRVLVSEQDQVSAEYLAMVLEKGGYRVDMAADATGSRALLARWKYAAWLVGRRLSDIDDSLHLIAEMRPRLDGTRIVILTSDEAALGDAQRHGISDSISKNDSRSRILEAVAAGGARTTATS